MTYTVDSIRVRSSSGGTWSTTDLVGGNFLLSSIYNTYTGAVLIMSSDVAAGFFYFDIYAEIPNIVNRNITINSWLQGTDLTAFRFLSTPPNVTRRSVMYMDATRSNYSFDKIASDRNPTMEIDDNEKIDLLLSRPDTDYERMNEYCLISVNGIFHYSSASADGLVVHGGVRGFEVGRTFNVGVHSFTGLGSIEKIQITADMITRKDNTTPLRDYVKINHNINLTGKTLLMCIGGYLHSFDEVYSVHEDHVEINIKRFLLPERLFDCLRRTDIESIYPLMNNEQFRSVSRDRLFSDEFINSYLISNTFMIVVNTPVINKETELVANEGIPGIYTTKILPNKPLIAGYNRVCEYIPQYEYNTWVLHCTEANKNAFLFTTAYEANTLLYTEQLQPELELENTHPYFLNLYVESLTVPTN